MYDITLTVMSSRPHFDQLPLRQQLTLCAYIGCPCINELRLQQCFSTPLEQQKVRNFIKDYSDDIIRKPMEFLTTSPENKERLILCHKLDEDIHIHNHPIITYMFWEEEHAGIRDYIQNYVRERCIAENIQRLRI